MRCDARTFRRDDDVYIADLPTSLIDGSYRGAQQIRAVRTLPSWICVWKAGAQIIQPGGSEERVADSMKHCVSI
jgi:hypothetical protein